MLDMSKVYRLDGQATVVTGGGRGLGEVFCDAFAAAGAKVAVADMIRENAEKVAEKLVKNGREAIPLEVDVRETESVNAMMAVVNEKWGCIDVVMNNAGVVNNIPAEELSDEDWEWVIGVDLTGVFKCCRAAAKYMIPQKKGSIVNVGSMSGVISNYPQPQCSYNAAKAGVIHLSKSLAGEWAQHNIRVNTISPGYMGTEMTKKGAENPEWFPHWIEGTPMRRMGEPEELGPLAVFLASDASSFMTGENVVIDGGYTVW